MVLKVLNVLAIVLAIYSLPDLGWKLVIQGDMVAPLYGKVFLATHKFLVGIFISFLTFILILYSEFDLSNICDIYVGAYPWIDLYTVLHMLSLTLSLSLSCIGKNPLSWKRGFEVVKLGLLWIILRAILCNLCIHTMWFGWPQMIL